MIDESSHPESINTPNASVPAQDFSEFQGKSKWAELSWYLVVFGFIAIAVAGLCIYLQRIAYRDFTMNSVLLGRYFLMAGITMYLAGRGIAYYQRLKKKKK